MQIVTHIASLYRWNGSVVEEDEVQLEIKTLSASSANVSRWLQKHRPYDVPEVLQLAVAGGSDEYVAFVRSALKTDDGGGVGKRGLSGLKGLRRQPGRLGCGQRKRLRAATTRPAGASSARRRGQ